MIPTPPRSGTIDLPTTDREHMRITLAQLAPVLGDLDANVERAIQAVVEAEGEGAELIVFPELFLSGYSIEHLDHDVAIERDDPRLWRIGAAASDTDVVVGFMESGRVHAHNAATYLQGTQPVHTHRKIYLVTYSLFEEGKHFRAGTTMRAFDTRLGRLAILLCNDAWQPQLAWLAVQDGAKVLLIPANSAESRFTDVMDTERYWRNITRFYASMLECYVVFVNRVGSEGELRFWGASHVVDPWGEVIAEAPRTEEALLHVEIDLAAVRKRRRQVPLIKEGYLGIVQRELTRILEEGGGM